MTEYREKESAATQLYEAVLAVANKHRDIPDGHHLVGVIVARTPLGDIGALPIAYKEPNQVLFVRGTAGRGASVEAALEQCRDLLSERLSVPWTRWMGGDRKFMFP